MTATNFAACFAITESQEGWHEFSDDPYDVGGATYSGVTQRTYNAYRLANKLPTQGVRRATDDEIRAIAKLQYWDPVRADELFAGLDLIQFDEAFNSGPVEAIMLLQGALGIVRDGQFGLETMAALQRVTDGAKLINDICAARLAFFHRLKTWWRFGTGWSARDRTMDVKALAMLKAAG